MAEPAEEPTNQATSKRRRFRRRRGAGTPGPSTKVFHGSSIEDALVAAARELGPGVEVIDARRSRQGGLFGFFAREQFEVTAVVPVPGSAPVRAAAEPAVDTEPALGSGDTTADRQPAFEQVLAEMADGVIDTIEFNEAAEPAAEPVAEPAPQLPSRRARPAPAPIPERRAPGGLGARAERAVGLIDLRQGRRIPIDPLGAASGRSERPSQLRRRLTTGGVGPLGVNPLTREVPGSVVDLRDARPEWSVDRLRRLGLGDKVLDLVAAFEPTSDLEWVQALATAIQVLMPEEISGHDTLLAGEGRASAVGLVQALASGKIPAFLLIDGQQIPATADELALSIRECLR